ncbi:hypothetical protein ACKB4K_001493 [Vibrio vulnificus]|uniref:hypothetical protein n=1 Tax=Vibrio vulnificus TaxID=672 RepID=UPI00102A5FC0|nr:hypothetical protein [Vibrio vulnificus]EHK2774203.1 hypothetical protein [Vibrio vulnificus]EJV2650981.1 hypothetical protein [Vibrio vulnificus]ELT7699897.1 hypothetical protein [Vibrio vulnificus]RZP88821.1 hypothetical protein D8T56_15625 [Vibrio vulnificus]HAS8307101.1 hypothetical protein [Vibrio vulnificus]
MDYIGCTTTDNSSIVKVTEKRSSFSVENKKRENIQKLAVDGCLITDSRERCDWILFQDSPKKKAFYVELKGCDVLHGISQLENTVKTTKDKFNGYKKECHLIASRVPSHSPSLAKKKLQFQKETGVTLSISTTNRVVQF